MSVCLIPFNQIRMKKQLIILLITVFISGYNAYSQESVSVDKWKEYIEELAEESANESQLEALYTELSYLSEHPMDLNQVTAEQLSRLPFLTIRISTRRATSSI